MRARNQFTQYDVLEVKGYFTSNPANADSFDPVEHTPLYKGPVEYPKMFYHPAGEERVLIAAEAVTNPATGEILLDKKGDPIMRGEQREIVWQIAHDAEEEAVLREEGWHDHPSAAIGARTGVAPPISTAKRISDLETALAKAQADLAKAKAGPATTEAPPPIVRRRSESAIA